MNKSEMKDFEEMIEGLSSILNLKKKMQETIRERGSCCNKGCCEEEEEDDSCPLLKELQTEFNEILEWAVGDSDRTTCKKKARKHWEKTHPGLPVPRIMKSEDGLPPGMSTICLLIDVLPLYLAEKKKCVG